MASKKRTKEMDVLFIIDSTGSMKNAIEAAHNKVEDIAFEIRQVNRKADFKFGCVCYRDKACDPKDENEVYDFDPEIESLSIFLGKIKAKGGGGDGPEDWVSALNDAFKLSWRKGKKAIIWLADMPAHGKRFAGRDKFPEEEAKLIPLIERLASEQIYFVGISLKKAALKTFSEMKAIYEAKGGKSFRIEQFSSESGDEIAGIERTMLESSRSVVNSAFADMDNDD